MVRCPDCDAEIDLDEDEVEEGEILSCPECEAELEVVQTHPVQLNVVSEDDEDSENEDLLDDGRVSDEDDDEDEDEDYEDDE